MLRRGNQEKSRSLTRSVHSKDRVDQREREPIQESCAMFQIVSGYFVFPV